MAQYITINSNQFDDLLDAISHGGGGGNVSDVYVNGVSALDSDHIAQIKTHKVLTLSEYTNLTQAEKENGIIYLVKPDTTGYIFHTSQDGKIVIRENQTINENLCFFCGYENQTGSDSIPQELVQYVPNNYNGASQNWVNGGTTQLGWGGFYNNHIQLWAQDWGSLIAGTMYGVVDFNQTGQQDFQYSDPYSVISQTYSIYCMGYKFAEYTAQP